VNLVAPAKGKRWPQRVAQTSNALDLEPDVFAPDELRALYGRLRRSPRQGSRKHA
jgi:hypothetical protein